MEKLKSDEMIIIKKSNAQTDLEIIDDYKSVKLKHIYLFS